LVHKLATQPFSIPNHCMGWVFIYSTQFLTHILHDMYWSPIIFRIKFISNQKYPPYRNVIVAISMAVRSKLLKTPNSLAIVLFKSDTICFSTYFQHFHVFQHYCSEIHVQIRKRSILGDHLILN
jgi:hypothetical protein